MKDLLNYIQSVTGEKITQSDWRDIVKNVVLPKMAGIKGSRWCIKDNFMNLMAKYSSTIYSIDKEYADILAEIALQRISHGAVIHENNSWLDPLPKEFWDYSSQWDKDLGITKGCYEFLIHGISTCIKHGSKEVKQHAFKILFYFVDDFPNCKSSFLNYFLNEHMQIELIKFVHNSEKLIEDYATFDDLCYIFTVAKSSQNSKFWLRKKYKNINIDQMIDILYLLRKNVSKDQTKSVMSATC